MKSCKTIPAKALNSLAEVNISFPPHGDRRAF